MKRLLLPVIILLSVHECSGEEFHFPLNSSHKECKEFVQILVKKDDLCGSSDLSMELLCSWQRTENKKDFAGFCSLFEKKTSTKVPVWWKTRLKGTLKEKENPFTPITRDVWSRNTQGILFNGCDGVFLSDQLILYVGEKTIRVPYENRFDGSLDQAIGISCLEFDDKVVCVVAENPSFGGYPTVAYCLNLTSSDLCWQIDFNKYLEAELRFDSGSTLELKENDKNLFIFFQGYELFVIGINKEDGSLTLRFSTDYIRR